VKIGNLGLAKCAINHMGDVMRSEERKSRMQHVLKGVVKNKLERDWNRPKKGDVLRGRLVAHINSTTPLRVSPNRIERVPHASFSGGRIQVQLLPQRSGFVVEIQIGGGPLSGRS